MRFRPAGEFITGDNGGTFASPQWTPGTWIQTGAALVCDGALKQRVGKETMRGVQQRLTRLGFKPGPVDGVWGNRTGKHLAFSVRPDSASGRLDGHSVSSASELAQTRLHQKSIMLTET